MPDHTGATATATLRLNELTLPCPDGLTLHDLLEAHGLAADAIATAVNGAFVPRTLRATTFLQPHDIVLTFQAIVGG